MAAGILKLLACNCEANGLAGGIVHTDLGLYDARQVYNAEDQKQKERCHQGKLYQALSLVLPAKTG